MKKEIKVNSELSNIRLDKFLVLNFSEYSRSQITSFIKQGNFLVNNKIEKASYITKEEDVINFSFIEEEKVKQETTLNYKIEYEDDYLYVINKPAGLVIYDGVGTKEETLVDLLIKDNLKLSDLNKGRPGIVHRLDKDTSGILIVAKDNKTHQELSDMFKEKKVKRFYLALVEGIIEEKEGIIKLPLKKNFKKEIKMVIDQEGREAISKFRLIDKDQSNSLLEVELITGRTHQIRAHLSYIKHPIVGDKVYNRKKYNYDFHLLQAYKLSFIHPITKKEIKIEIEPLKEIFLFKKSKIIYN